MLPKLLAYLAIMANSLIYSSHANNITTTSATSTTEDLYFNSLNMGKKMKAIGIVPHVIPVPPQARAMVTYFTRFFRRIKVQQGSGDTFRASDLSSSPAVFWPSQQNEYYTLFFTAINATNGTGHGKRDPNRLINATQYHNWIVNNVPGAGRGIMAGGDELFPYYQPAELQENEHRLYVILIFRQYEKITVKLRKKKKYIFFHDTEHYDLHRSQFTIRKFAERYELIELVAGNYFHLEREPESKSRFRIFG